MRWVLMCEGIVLDELYALKKPKIDVFLYAGCYAHYGKSVGHRVTYYDLTVELAEIDPDVLENEGIELDDYGCYYFMT